MANPSTYRIIFRDIEYDGLTSIWTTPYREINQLMCLPICFTTKKKLRIFRGTI